MRTISQIIFGLFGLFVLGVACSEEKTEIPKVDNIIQQPINPNGDSELALLMRAMEEEVKRIKDQVDKGEPITITINHEEILTAHATEPKKAASPEFKAFAAAYLQAIEALKTATPGQSATIYDQMVSSCMSCHQTMCPGPMMRIKKLQ